MAIAVLVLAYREPAVLSMVLPVYRRAGFDVFVHLDAKASLEDYKRAMGDEAQHCRFVESREQVFWAGWSMIRATFRLLEAATSAGPYDNYLLVSDDTLPIVPVDRLKLMLGMQIERISARPLCDADIFTQRYRRFFFLDHAATSLLGRPIETSCVDDAYFATLARLAERRQLGKAEVPLHYGSQWWCLTAGAVRTVMALHAERRDLRESFEFSAAPDEMYVQTLVANFARERRIVDGPIYVDWSREPKPYLFSDFSFQGRTEQDHLFVRKVSSRNRIFLEEALQRIG